LINPLAGWSQLWIVFGGDNSQLNSKGFLDDNSFSINFVFMLLHRLLAKIREVGFDLISHFHHYHHFLSFFLTYCYQCLFVNINICPNLWLLFITTVRGEITNWWLTFRNLFQNHQWSSFVSFFQPTMPMTIAV
jgi:hypothetical protein